MKNWFLKSKKYSSLLIPLLLLAFSLSPAPIAQAGEAEILIFHTNNVTGYLLPCPT